MSHQSAGLGRFRVAVALGDPPVLTNVEHNLGGTEAFKVVTYYRELGLAAHWVKQLSMHKEPCANTCRYCACSLANWLYDLATTVARVFRVQLAPNKSIVGEDIVRHQIDSHLNTLLRGVWWAWE